MEPRGRPRITRSGTASPRANVSGGKRRERAGFDGGSAGSRRGEYWGGRAMHGRDSAHATHAAHSRRRLSTNTVLTLSLRGGGNDNPAIETADHPEEHFVRNGFQRARLPGFAVRCRGGKPVRSTALRGACDTTGSLCSGFPGFLRAGFETGRRLSRMRPEPDHRPFATSGTGM